MSWDSYIDNLIAQTKDSSGNAHCSKACIIGLDGGGMWTNHASNHLSIVPTDAAKIANVFKSGDFTSFMTDKITVDGNSFQFLREEDQKVVYAKKKGVGAITLQASKTAIVIGLAPDGSQQGNLNKGVAVIAEYLESLGM